MNYEKYQTFTLNDVTLKIFSGGTPNTKKQEYWGGKIPWLSSGETKNKFINITFKNITLNGAKNSSTQLACKGDVLIATAGQGYTRGQVSLACIDTFINQSIIAIRTDEKMLNNKYLFYNLTNRYNELRQISNGNSIRGSITGAMIKSLKIKIPNLKKQNKIAEILYSLDQKIENNKNMNNKLSRISSLLYNQWFVEFEFPNEEGKPYKSSGGEMVDSELGLIPKEWEIQNLNKKISQIKCKSKPNECKRLLDLSSMPEYSLSLEKFKKGNELKTNLFLMNKGNLLYGSIRPYLGKFGIAPYDGLTTGTIHQYLPKNIYDYSLIASLTFSNTFNNFCIKLSRGTKMPVINWNDFVTYKFAYNDTFSKKYNSFMKPIFDKIILNINENIELTKVRDLLLPKLMSGEIEIPIKE